VLTQYNLTAWKVVICDISNRLLKCVIHILAFSHIHIMVYIQELYKIVYYIFIIDHVLESTIGQMLCCTWQVDKMLPCKNSLFFIKILCFRSISETRAYNWQHNLPDIFIGFIYRCLLCCVNQSNNQKISTL
jgi:hypothetical protein